MSAVAICFKSCFRREGECQVKCTDKIFLSYGYQYLVLQLVAIKCSVVVTVTFSTVDTTYCFFHLPVAQFP